MELTDKVILVTGASSGLGEQIAYAAAKAGAVVVVAARRRDRLIKVADRCRVLSGKTAVAIQMDITRVDQVDGVFAAIQANFGHLDVLINAAGFGLLENFADFNMSQAHQMFRVNTLGVMYVTQKATQMMLKQKTGEIVNVASVAGKIPTPKSAVYAATKAALIAFDDALRLEVHRFGINVLTVNPGPIKTEFFKTADPTGAYLKSVRLLAVTPEYLGAKIVRQIGRHRRELTTPWFFSVADHGYRLMPYLGDWLAGSVFNFK